MYRKTGLYMTLLLTLNFFQQLTFAQTIGQDSLKNVKTSGVFSGEIITVGNFNAEKAYKLNDYFISLTDITQDIVDSLKGKNITITGKLLIKIGRTFPAKTSTDGTIYEPYKEPDRIFISNPIFSVNE
jgi:hypothetical protein